MLTRDGERIVLATDGPSKSYCTISTRDGRQLFPLLVANTTAASALSADGRYLMVSSVGTGTSMTYQTFDLETGTPVWSCSEETVFSRNGRTAYSLVRAGENTSLVIRSMDDGRELNRVEIPKVEGRRLSGIGTQRNERVYFSFESNDTSPDSVMIADADIWSGRVEGNILTDFRREPMNYHRQVNAGLNVIRVNEETICYELQQRDLYKSAEGRNWLKFLEWASHFRLVTRYSSQTYAWQQVSPVTGWHTGSPIPMEIPIFTIAPDGKWIVTGGQNVAAYAIPVGSNLIEILAAVLLPWGLAWLVCYWRNRTAGRTTDAVPHPHQPLEELK